MVIFPLVLSWLKEKERKRTSEFVLLPADGIDSEGVRVLIARGDDGAC